jgi:hypothetical protein
MSQLLASGSVAASSYSGMYYATWSRTNVADNFARSLLQHIRLLSLSLIYIKEWFDLNQKLTQSQLCCIAQTGEVINKLL